MRARWLWRRSDGDPCMDGVRSEGAADVCLHVFVADVPDAFGVLLEVVGWKSEEGVDCDAGADAFVGLPGDEEGREGCGACAFEFFWGDAGLSEAVEELGEGLPGGGQLFGRGAEVVDDVAGIDAAELGGGGVIGEAEAFADFGEDGARHVLAPFVE